jgi:hypothetical protein
MAGQVTNLIYGPPTYIKIGPYGTAKDSCTDVGFTDGGLKLVAAYTMDKHMVDQHRGPVDVNLKEVNFTLEMTLAQPSLANLQFALGLSDASLSGSVLSVGSGISIPKLTIYFQGPGPAGGTRDVKIQRCYLSDPSPLSSTKANSNLTLKFTLLEDTTVADSKQSFFVITDSVA